MLFVGEPDAPATTGPNLFEIDLSNCTHMHPEPCCRLLSQKCTSLTTLFLQGIVDVEIDWKVLQVLVKSLKHLRNLEIGPGHTSNTSNKRKHHSNTTSNTKGKGNHHSFPSLSKLSASSSSSSAPHHWPSSRGIEYVVKYLRTTMLHLNFSGTPVVAAAMEHMQTMNHLLTLNLKGCVHIDNSICSILPNWKLQSLDLSYIPLLTYTNGLENIYNCEELQILKINGLAQITDVHVLDLLLHRLPRLNTLETQDCPNITAHGSLLEIVNSKKTTDRIVLTQKTTRTTMKTRTHRTNRTTHGTTRAIGFAPAPTRDALNHQQTYRALLLAEQHATVTIQQWWRKYIRQILLLKQARRVKIQNKMSATSIQRIWRGRKSRHTTQKYVHDLLGAVIRLELCYIRRVQHRLKKKALGFFINRVLAFCFHRWIEKVRNCKTGVKETAQLHHSVHRTKVYVLVQLICYVTVFFYLLLYAFFLPDARIQTCTG